MLEHQKVYIVALLTHTYVYYNGKKETNNKYRRESIEEIQEILWGQWCYDLQKIGEIYEKRYG